MNSKLSICNRALRLCGENILTTLEEPSKLAEECNFLYPIIKREVIESYPWKCCRKLINLQSIYESNQEEYTQYPYKFLLPYDCVRVVSVNDTNNFLRDGIYMYAANSNIQLCYIADVPEEYFTIRLSKIIALKLAVELVFALNDNTELINRLYSTLELETRKVTALDSEEGCIANKADFNTSSNNWLIARR